MARLGSKKRPIMVRIPDDRTLEYVTRMCDQHGLQYIAELVPGQPPDLAELEQAIDPTHQQALQPVRRSSDIGRNDPCPCGSGAKFKKCCSGMTPAHHP